MKFEMQCKHDELTKLNKSLNQGVDKMVQQENQELAKKVQSLTLDLKKAQNLEQDNKKLKEMLDKQNINYISVSGDYATRIEKAIKCVDDIMSNS